MSKLSATLSIVIALVVGGLVTYLAIPPTGGAPKNDGNPIGFNLETQKSQITAIGSAPTAALLTACAKTKTCTARIYLQMPVPNTVPSPTPQSCPNPKNCFQFTGTVQLSSRDWKGSPHPDPGYSPEPRYAAGTIYISDK